MKNPEAVALGKMGGSVKSEAKAKSSAANAKLGGRPVVNLPDGRFSVLAHNSQGASNGMVGTAKEINAWLRGWNDPENLSVTVTDENGSIIASKTTGRKTIKW